MANKKQPAKDEELAQSVPLPEGGRKVNLPYGPRNRVQTPVGKVSMTKSEFARECQIENIVDKFTTTGLITHVSTTQPQYGDAPDIDFHEALLAVKNAQENFENLPTNIVEKFGGDPAKFVEFCQSASAAELADLGLIEPHPLDVEEKPVTEPTEAPATNVANDSGTDA